MKLLSGLKFLTMAIIAIFTEAGSKDFMAGIGAVFSEKSMLFDVVIDLISGYFSLFVSHVVALRPG
jgi:hypothetical protein